MDVRQSAVDRTAGFEDFIEHFYLDTKSKVTVGYGHMLANADAAASAAMKLNGNDATEKDKREEWTLIKSKDPGHPASYYKQFTKLKLDMADANSLLRGDLQDAASDLATRFPSLDDYPEAAQDALLDMMFNIGLTKFTKSNWPKLFAAVEKKDWKTAAAESNRPDVPDDRNEAIHDLFLSAAGLFDLRGGAAAVALSFTQQLAGIFPLIEKAADLPKFYPNGITKIRLGMKVAGAEIDFEMTGPDRAAVLPQGSGQDLAERSESRSVDDLDLQAYVKLAAEQLLAAHPSVVFTSGRRTVKGQADAIAGNVVANRKYIEETYAASSERDALQNWVDDHPEATTTTAISAGLEGIMNGWSDTQKGKLSRHFSGEAFDVKPVSGSSGDAIKTTIKTLPKLRKFLEAEGGLTIWHAEFSP